MKPMVFKQHFCNLKTTLSGKMDLEYNKRTFYLNFLIQGQGFSSVVAWVRFCIAKWYLRHVQCWVAATLNWVITLGSSIGLDEYWADLYKSPGVSANGSKHIEETLQVEGFCQLPMLNKSIIYLSNRHCELNNNVIQSNLQKRPLR